MSKRRRLQYPGEIARPTEKIVETIEIELFRPDYIPSVQVESLEHLDKTIRPMTVPPLPKAIAPPPELTPTLVQEIKNSKYRNVTIDLSVAHTDIPLGLRDMGIVADAMTVISLTAGASFTYKMNSTSNDSTPGSAGLTETEFEIEELYITNVAQAGASAVIRVNWNPLLIRVRP